MKKQDKRVLAMIQLQKELPTLLRVLNWTTYCMPETPQTLEMLTNFTSIMKDEPWEYIKLINRIQDQLLKTNKKSDQAQIGFWDALRGSLFVTIGELV